MIAESDKIEKELEMARKAEETRRQIAVVELTSPKPTERKKKEMRKGTVPEEVSKTGPSQNESKTQEVNVKKTEHITDTTETFVDKMDKASVENIQQQIKPSLSLTKETTTRPQPKRLEESRAEAGASTGSKYHGSQEHVAARTETSVHDVLKAGLGICSVDLLIFTL